MYVVVGEVVVVDVVVGIVTVTVVVTHGLHTMNGAWAESLAVPVGVNITSYVPANGSSPTVNCAALIVPPDMLQEVASTGSVLLLNEPEPQVSPVANPLPDTKTTCPLGGIRVVLGGPDVGLSVMLG